MFVFEDISRFADKDIQTVLKNVDTSSWAMGLKGASEDLKEKSSRICPSAPRKCCAKKWNTSALPSASVEAKQQEIVDVIRKLEDSGEIDLNAMNEEEELVS